MEAGIIGPAFEAVKCLSVPVVRPIGYAKNLKKNFEKLDNLAKDLYDKRDYLNLKVNAGRPGKVPTPQLLTWFEKVEKIENRINAITVDYKHEKKCLGGWCPNICSRLKIGKQVAELIDNISVLKESIQSDSEAIVDAPLSVVERVPAPIIEAGNSAELTLERLMAHIKSESIRTIGVWGMGGVGKTTVMKKFNNLSEIVEMFDIVIWVTVSRDWSLRKVQDEVARRLSLTLSNAMSDGEVSRKLYQRLENTKYLLLLDDVWDKVNLQEVGIPTPNGCKIVLTTRYLSVCKKMETDAEIKVEVLSAQEAWSLFCEKVGRVFASPEIETFARDVVKECGGLPLAVIVVGGALRKEEDVHVWRNAVRELSSASTSQISDMEEEVFKRLKFSYDKLKCDRQRCFLYGALYPEDYEINADRLIEYWRAAGFIEGTKSLAEAADRGYAIIKDLADASLFEKGKNNKGVYVKMHDVIRDLALRITSVEEGGNKFLVRAGKESRDPPGAEEWKECNAVSFIQNHKLRRLPKRVHCPDLITLLLQDIWFFHIPESFFESMAALRVLDLSGTDNKSLPPSICNLISLRGLYLNGVRNFVALPPQIGALKELEVLHMESCGKFQHLSVEVGELSHLKSLHVSCYDPCNSDMLVPQGIISRLSLLEDLSIYIYAIRINYKGWDRNLEHLAKEIGKLKRLAVLEIVFTRVEHLESFVRASEPWRDGTLSSFILYLTLDLSRYLNAESPRKVKDLSFDFVDGTDVPDVVRQVLRRTLHFELWRHRSIRKLEELGAENMTGLISLDCHRCYEMESLIEETCPLPSLQELHLYNMPKLRNIWGEGQQRCHFPVNLTVLDLKNCDSLPKVLFSHSIIQQLPNLEKISIVRCEGVQEVISGDNNKEYVDVLPKLRSLDLVDLLDLTSISKKTLACPCIELIQIDGCYNLKSLPFGIHNTSTLKDIACKRTWWESLHWEDNKIKTQLQTKIHSWIYDIDALDRYIN